jgi:hypothetical protein
MAKVFGPLCLTPHEDVGNYPEQGGTLQRTDPELTTHIPAYRLQLAIGQATRIVTGEDWASIEACNQESNNYPSIPFEKS